MDNETLSTLTTLGGIVLVAAVWLLRPFIMLRLIERRPRLAIKLERYQSAYKIFALIATVIILSVGRYINIKLKGGHNFVKGVEKDR
jgi:hypothetical protein